MKLGRTLLTFIALCMILTACAPSQNYDEINNFIDAHNIVLGLDPDTVFEELGEEPEQEMCVYGYEYTFEDSGLNIGFRLDGDTVRRVTIRNSKDSIFGIHVGDPLNEVNDIMQQNGFDEDNSVNNRYKSDSLYFSAISKDGLSIDQLIIEVIDNDVIN